VTSWQSSPSLDLTFSGSDVRDGWVGGCRIGAGQYQFGTKKIRLELQGGNRLMGNALLLRDRARGSELTWWVGLMGWTVRMGGGGASFVAFVDKYGASECRKVAASAAAAASPS
jgi:hypothetical protein